MESPLFSCCFSMGCSVDPPPFHIFIYHNFQIPIKIVPSEELANDEHSVERRVQGIYIHPLYQKNVNHDYDFALIRLDKAVPINRCLADLLTSWEEVAKRSCPREW